MLNLHGNSRKKEKTPDGGKDDNVFEIEQGVAIGLFVREPERAEQATVRHADLWGLEEGKSKTLAATDVSQTHWDELSPASPHFLFIPYDANLEREYDRGWKMTSLFPLNGVGMTTARDHVVIDFVEGPLLQRAQLFRDSTDSDVELCRQLGVPQKKGWNIQAARRLIRQETDLRQFIESVTYRPFDKRLIFYHDSLVWRTVKRVMQHMLAGDNLALIATRQTRDPFDVYVTNTIAGHKCMAAYDINTVFPLYLYPEEGTTEQGRRPNLNPKFIKEFSAKLGLEFIPDGQGDLENTFGPEDIFYYAYAVFHSPTYREHHAEFLKIDFPRLPLTSDRNLFTALIAKGKRLADLHLMRETGQLGDTPAFNITGTNEVERVRYVELPEDESSRGKDAPPTEDISSPPTSVGGPPSRPELVEGCPNQAADAQPPSSVGGASLPRPGRVYINKTQYFAGVEPEVWEFPIGGYQVCQKWLKDRTIKKLGRPLSYDDITHYQHIVLALRETIQLMAEIDQIIPTWPIE